MYRPLGDIDWGQIITTGISTAGSVLTARQRQQMIDDEARRLSQLAAQQQSQFSALPAAINPTWLVLGGLALLGVVMLGRR